MVMQGHKGFTMIELMVAVGVSASLLLVATPYTNNIVTSMQVKTAGDKLLQSFRHGKSVALRNPLASGTSAPAAGIKLAGGRLLVCQGDPTNAACALNAANTLWHTTLPEGVQIAVNGTSLTTIAIDNTGSVIGTTGDSTYAVSKGGDNESDILL